MAFAMESNKEFCDHIIQQLRRQVEFGDWHDLQNAPEGATLTGRRFQQDKDNAITIDMDNYIDAMTNCRMPHDRAKQDNELLTAAEHRAVRGMNGQFQWVVRLLLHKMQFRGIAACWP
eukprot:8249088-Pyramimonas_sp.AAC.1